MMLSKRKGSLQTAVAALLVLTATANLVPAQDDDASAAMAEEMLLESVISGEAEATAVATDNEAPEVPADTDRSIEDLILEGDVDTAPAPAETDDGIVTAEDIFAAEVSEGDIPDVGTTADEPAEEALQEKGVDINELMGIPPAEESASVESMVEDVLSGGSVPAEEPPPSDVVDAVTEDVFTLPELEEPVAAPPAAEPEVVAAPAAAGLDERVEDDLQSLVEDAFADAAATGVDAPPPVTPAMAREPAVPAAVAVTPVRAAAIPTVRREIRSVEYEELLRRQALAAHAREVLGEADEDLRSGRYKDAVTKYTVAMQSLTLPEDYEDRMRAQRGLAEAHYSQSIYLEKQAVKADDLKPALVAAKQAMDEGHPRGEARVVYIKRLIESPPPPKKPESRVRWRQKSYAEKQEKIAELLRRGRQHATVGEMDEAMSLYENVLKEDPQNTEAMRLMRKAGVRTYDRSTMELEATRVNLMADVRRTWNPRDYAVVEDPTQRMNVGQIRQKSSLEVIKNRIVAKMEAIEIPEIDFRLANINDVVTFLQEASVEFDRTESDDDRRGVNIILNLQSGSSGRGPAAAPASDDPFAETLGGGGASLGGSEVPLITFSARYISLLEALKIVTNVSNLKWRIEGKVVMIVPKNAPDGDIIIRMYDVLASVEDKLSQIGDSFANAGGGGIGSDDFRTLDTAGPSSVEVDWKEAFDKMGVRWPDGSSIRYIRAMGKLVVANTENNLAEFEKILSELNIVPYQIEIETRFVEVSRTDLNSLGVEWMLTDDWELMHHQDDANLPAGGRRRIMVNGNETGGGFTKGMRFLSAASAQNAVADDILRVSSVLTNPELSMVLHALEQRGYADLLSAPKVTTQAGQEATIKVVTEYIYPTDFEVTPVTGTSPTGASTIRGGVVEPSGFETREVGVILSVLPDVSPEGRMINLTMTPEVVSEPEWKDYGSVYTDDDGNENRLSMQQPFFHSRAISTSISIYNGATVVMGGMITENRVDIEDKVPLLGDLPLLGRLFRSKSERSDKRNLLIFVTARLVDPAGRELDQSGAGIDRILAGVGAGGDVGSSSVVTP